MWYFHEGMGWWVVFGWIWMVIVLGVITALVVWGIRKVTGNSGTSGKPSPLDIARERYARGEITREEFEQIKKDL